MLTPLYQRKILEERARKRSEVLVIKYSLIVTSERVLVSLITFGESSCESNQDKSKYRLDPIRVLIISDPPTSLPTIR